MTEDTPQIGPAAHDDAPDRSPWQAPQLAVLGSFAAATAAQTVSAPDMGGSGTIAGDSGTIL